MSHMEVNQLDWSALTDVGRFRKDNQDAFLALRLNEEGVQRLGKIGDADFSQGDYMFAVSDGMGGANAGDFASRVAVDTITRLFPQHYLALNDAQEVDFEALLSQLFEEIHAQLTHLGFCYPELRGMGATLSLAWFRREKLYFAHVGDSRIYHLPADGGIQQLSVDHTHVGWLSREGKLTEQQARVHPGRNSLQQVLGGKNQNLSPQFGCFDYSAGDVFLLCSDGLVEGLWDRGMDRLIRRPSPLIQGNPAERLVSEAVATDGTDNTTAVVVEFR